MNKSFYLHILGNMAPDLCDFLQGQFSCCNHSCCSQGMPEIPCSVIAAVGLSADMTVDLRTLLSGYLKDSRVRYNKSVRFHFFQIP